MFIVNAISECGTYKEVLKCKTLPAMSTYRAAYWTDGHADVRLTSEDQKDLPYDDLMAAARREFDASGMEMGDGRIVIGEYTE